MKTFFLSVVIFVGLSASLCAQTTQKDTLIKKDTNQIFGEVVPISKDTGKVYEIVERMPYFLGGNLGDFIVNNINYPSSLVEANITGKVIVEFQINADSTVTNVVSRSPNAHRLLQEEAIRIIKLTNKHWIPGSQNGKLIKVRSRIPIAFLLDDE